MLAAQCTKSFLSLRSFMAMQNVSKFSRVGLSQITGIRTNSMPNSPTRPGSSGNQASDSSGSRLMTHTKPASAIQSSCSGRTKPEVPRLSSSQRKLRIRWSTPYSTRCFAAGRGARRLWGRAGCAQTTWPGRARYLPRREADRRTCHHQGGVWKRQERESERPAHWPRG